MSEPLQWVKERGTHVAQVVGARYVVQPELILTNGVQRYAARLVRTRAPAVSLGYHPHPAAAKQECQTHYNRRTRWDEDTEVGAIG